MKNKITLEEFKKENIAINARTQEEYDNLMRFFDIKGIIWDDGENEFDDFREETCIQYEKDLDSLSCCNKRHYEIYGYKIITPTQIKEYNEFMRERPCRLGKEENCIANDVKNCRFDREKCPFKEEFCSRVDAIIKDAYIKPNQYLTIGQAIDYMLESEDNVIEYFDINNKEKYKEKIKDNLMYYSKGGKWIMETSCFREIFENWTNIKKHIEEKKEKTLKEKLEAKEPFMYKDIEYKFNIHGVILEPKGGAMSFKKIQEILKEAK